MFPTTGEHYPLPWPADHSVIGNNGEVAQHGQHYPGFESISMHLGYGQLGTEEDIPESFGDTISIQVYEEPDLSGDFEVKEDGTITYPLLGSVKVSSLSKSETESTITRLLEKDYLVNPYIHITIKKYHQQNIIILGCVQKPGSYPFPPDMNLTLLQAISIAGGFTGYASVNDTKLVRTSSGGKKNTIDARVNDIVNGRRKDIRLEANDLIFVPERLF